MPAVVDIVNRGLQLIGSDTITAGEFATPTTKAGRVTSAAWPIVRDEVSRSHPWNSLTKRARLSETTVGTAITGITQASPGVVTTSAAHGLVDGERIRIDGVTGMTQVNATKFYVDAQLATTFDLLQADLTAFSTASYTAYSANGTVTRVPMHTWDNMHAIPSDCLRVLEVGGQESDYTWVVEDGFILHSIGTGPLEIRYIFQDAADPNDWDAILVQAMAARLAFDIVEAITSSNTKTEAMRAMYLDVMSRARAMDAHEGSPAVFDEDSWITARFS